MGGNPNASLFLVSSEAFWDDTQEGRVGFMHSYKSVHKLWLTVDRFGKYKNLECEKLVAFFCFIILPSCQIVVTSVVSFVVFSPKRSGHVRYLEVHSCTDQFTCLHSYSSPCNLSCKIPVQYVTGKLRPK